MKVIMLFTSKRKLSSQCNNKFVMWVSLRTNLITISLIEKESKSERWMPWL